MANIIIPTYYKDTKPPLGSQINWGHPLSQGLVGCWIMNEGGGLKTINLCDNDCGILISGAFFKNKVISFDGTNDYAALPKKNNISFNNVPFSGLFKARLISGTNNIFVSRGGSNSGSPFGGWYANTNYFITKQGAAAANAYSRLSNITIASSFLQRGWTGKYSTAGTTGQSFSVYTDGKLDNSTETNTAATGSDVNLSPYIACRTVAGVPATFSNIEIEFLFLWKRIINPSEFIVLYESPYQFIQPLRRRFFSYPALMAEAGTQAPVAVGRHQFIMVS